MVAQIGCPHFFITLSAADMSWPELFRIIARQNGQLLTDEDIAAMSYEEKASMLRNDPVLAARHFDHRLRAFFTDILVHALTLGVIQTHFYRVEFQNRGSPHVHCLIWTKDGPDTTNATDNEVVHYFENKICGQLPRDDNNLRPIVDHVQRHSHSVVCRKKKSACRFNFPRPPSKRTILASPPNEDVDAAAVTKWQADVIGKVQDVLDKVDNSGSVTLDDVLSTAGVTEDDYHRALSVNVKGRSLVLQRDVCDVNINNYNATILSAWQANMDIQPVLEPA